MISRNSRSNGNVTCQNGTTRSHPRCEIVFGCLLIHLRDLLLELGRGFAFVGSQVPLVVDDHSFYVDLLFYHTPIGVSTYRVTRQLPEPVREELPSVEDLQEVVHKLRSEMEMLRKELTDEE